MKKITLLLLLVLPLSATETGNLIVEINNLRTHAGVIKVALFKGPEGFPKAEKAYRRREIPANGSTSISFNNIPYGTYGVTVIHDENGNGKLDTKLIVIPAEGVGTSNNPQLKGPPTFDKSKFDFTSQEMTISIKLMFL